MAPFWPAPHPGSTPKVGLLVLGRAGTGWESEIVPAMPTVEGSILTKHIWSWHGYGSLPEVEQRGQRPPAGLRRLPGPPRADAGRGGRRVGSRLPAHRHRRRLRQRGRCGSRDCRLRYPPVSYTHLTLPTILRV